MAPDLHQHLHQHGADADAVQLTGVLVIVAAGVGLDEALVQLVVADVVVRNAVHVIRVTAVI